MEGGGLSTPSPASIRTSPPLSPDFSRMYFEKLVKGGEKKGGEGLGDGEKQGWGYLSFPPPPHRAIPLPPPFCPASFPSPLLLEGGGPWSQEVIYSKQD